MAPNRKVAHRQLELLVEFAESHRDIVLGNQGKGPLGQQEAHKAWEELARRLNSIGGGLIKTPANWKRYWHLLKCRTKGKAADIRRSHGGTGGGPNKIIPLSDLEERIISIIGKVAVEGIPGVRIPFNFDLTAETQPNGSHSASNGSPSETQPSGSSSDMAPSSAMRLPVNTNLDMEFPTTECQEVELEISLSEQPRYDSAFFEQPRDEPADPATEPARSAAPEPREPVAAASGSRASRRSSRPRQAAPRRDEGLPGWAYALEERRIAVEERIADELAGVGATNRGILETLQQLVGLLQTHLSKE